MEEELLEKTERGEGSGAEEKGESRAAGRFGSCRVCCISIFNDSKIQPLTCQRQREMARLFPEP